MKKQYMKPQMEVVELEIHHMLANSAPGWDGEIQAPGISWDDDIFIDDNTVL